MTVSRLNPPLAVGSLDEAFEALRGHGLRVSAARRLVLEALFAAEGPVSADAIAHGLDGRLPGSDLASVYRNLEAFEALGLVRHVHVGHGPGLYGLASEGEREYLVCESCDRIQTLPPGTLDGVKDAIREQLGFEARFTHFPIAGSCAACLERGERPTVEEHPHA